MTRLIITHFFIVTRCFLLSSIFFNMIGITWITGIIAFAVFSLWCLLWSIASFSLWSKPNLHYRQDVHHEEARHHHHSTEIENRRDSDRFWRRVRWRLIVRLPPTPFLPTVDYLLLASLTLSSSSRSFVWIFPSRMFHRKTDKSRRRARNHTLKWWYLKIDTLSSVLIALATT